VERWDLTSLPPSTEKERPRAAHPDAPRVPRRDGQIPRVLFSSPECRAVAVELRAGEAMGEHHVRERALVQVVRGRVEIDASGETADCGAGTLVVFERGESHSVRSLEPSLLLLILAPWPAHGHYTETEAADPQHLPPNAAVERGDRPPSAA
jgi:quercetin dioxygenase-like cupin family protein